MEKRKSKYHGGIMSGCHVINIDLDGTLTNGEVFWETRPTPNKEMCKYVRKLYYSRKYIIIIWTARRWNDAQKTVGWLIENNIPFHGILMEKGATDIYIDDKCVLPTRENLERLLNEDITDAPSCGRSQDILPNDENRAECSKCHSMVIENWIVLDGRRLCRRCYEEYKRLSSGASEKDV